MKQKTVLGSYGVNEVLAFALVFTLILTSITLLYSQAYPLLEEEKDVEVNRNVERSLSILQQNFNTVAEGQAPSRGTELKVSNSQLGIVENGYRVKYSFYNSSTGNYTNVSSTSDAFVYTTQADVQYSYVNSAIIRRENESIYFVESPNAIRSSNGTLQIELIELNHQGDLISGGIHTVVANGGNGQVIVSESDPGEQESVDVYMETPTTYERDFWRDYYQDTQEFKSCQNESPTEFSCTSTDQDEILISYRYIEFEYQQ